MIVVHNYHFKNFKSSEELQRYFSECLELIHPNFKVKTMVDLKVMKYVTIIGNKKCVDITHILSSNLLEEFADKYLHSLLIYCADTLSRTKQSTEKFFTSF